MLKSGDTLHSPSRGVGFVVPVGFGLFGLGGIFASGPIVVHGFYALVFVFAVVNGVDLVRARLTLEDDDLVYVRGVLGARRIPWADVQDFSTQRRVSSSTRFETRERMTPPRASPGRLSAEGSWLGWRARE